MRWGWVLVTLLLQGCGNGDDAAVTSPTASSPESCSVSPLGSPPDPSQVTTSIPITVASIQNQIRFSIPVQIGSTTVTALLDTGSSGVRVLRSSLKPEDVSLTSIPASQTYNGGLALHGVKGFASVTLKGQTTPNPIPIMVVTSACNGTPCQDVPLNDSVIYGFAAIIGIGLRGPPTGIRSPIAAMSGHPAFAILTSGDAGTLGDDAGVLKIGLQEADFAAVTHAYQLAPEVFATASDAGAFPVADGGPLNPDASAPDGGEVVEDASVADVAEDGGAPDAASTAADSGVAPAWDDTRVPACLRDTTTGASWCEGTLFDTGEPTVYVETTGESPYYLPWGDTVEIIVEGQGGCVFDEYQVAVGEPPSNQIEIRLVDTNDPYINLAQLAFYRYNVIFDPWNGRIDLGKR
jgi:hypothetical protein